MKKLSFALLFLMMVFTIVGCNRNSNRTSNIAQTQVQSTQTAAVENNTTKKISAGGSTVDNNVDVRIKLTFNSEEVIIKMHDNPTSRDFLALLPLTLTLKDYAETEKIADLPKRLSTEVVPGGSDPSVGDFTYYSPWGNIAIFYKDFSYSSGLIILGRIESGVE